MALCCGDEKEKKNIITPIQHFSMHKNTENIRINSGAIPQAKFQQFPPQQMINQTIRKTSVTGQQNNKNLHVTYEKPLPPRVINQPKINNIEVRNKHQ